MAVTQLSVRQLQQRLQNGDTPLLVDVREPQEFDFVHLKDSTLIPLRQLPQNLDRLDKKQEIILICHHGIRSQQAADYMDYVGFTHVVNLEGGIEAWAMECDDTMPRY